MVVGGWILGRRSSGQARAFLVMVCLHGRRQVVGLVQPRATHSCACGLLVPVLIKQDFGVAAVDLCPGTDAGQSSILAVLWDMGWWSPLLPLLELS